MTQGEIAMLVSDYCIDHCEHWYISHGEGIKCPFIQRGLDTPKGCPIQKKKNESFKDRIKKYFKIVNKK